MQPRKLTLGAALAALSGLLLAACGSTAATSKATLNVGGVIAITGSSSFEGGNLF